MSKTTVSLLLILLGLAGCGGESGEKKLGGVGNEDARALDEAAEKLEVEAAQ